MHAHLHVHALGGTRRRFEQHQMSVCVRLKLTAKLLSGHGWLE
jgi:hypothetical protein